MIEVKAKSIDTSTGENPFRGKKGGIRPEWAPYLEDVAFQFAVLQELFPDAHIIPYLCLTDRSKTTSIDQIFAKFELLRPKGDDRDFCRPLVSYVGNVIELRKDPFLSNINVASEVEELLPGIEKSSAVFVESLTDGLKKIAVPINLDCRKCEYRYVSGGDAKRTHWTSEGFRDCWGALADVDPNLLDYYHATAIQRSRGIINPLISRGRVKLCDVEEPDLVKADGTVGPINERQRIQRKYTVANREYFAADLKRRLDEVAIPCSSLTSRPPA